jgi:3-phenylpropionate/cinnamic acid dioxygenase small subunit
MGGDELTPPAGGALATDDVFKVHGFLLNEAELLDDRKWTEWLELLTDDFQYLLPLPVTRDNPELPAYDDIAYLQAENRGTLSGWVARLSPQNIDTAWSENPPARVRHFITNIRARKGDAPGEISVRANILISISRLDDAASVFAAERHDTLRAEKGALKLALRKVYLEQNLPTWSLRVIV